MAKMSDPNELIRLARDAIGDGNANTDWRIAPTEHAVMLEQKAPALSERLRDSLLQGLANAFEEWNDRAAKARDKFKHTAGLADRAVFCSASLAALLLVAGGVEVLTQRVGAWAVRGVAILSIVSSCLALMWLSQVKGGALSQRWAEARAKAEAKRLAYFRAVLEEPSEEPLNQLLALEYTRRFLLDNQLQYFKERGLKHEQAADLALLRTSIATCASASLTGVAAALTMWHREFAALAGLGVIASAYAALIASRSSMDRDCNNAVAYLKVRCQLADRALELDRYRQRVAAMEKDAAQAFFEPIFVTLEADHRAFLSEAEQRDVAIGAMADRLDAAKKALGSTASVPNQRAPQLLSSAS